MTMPSLWLLATTILAAQLSLAGCCKSSADGTDAAATSPTTAPSEAQCTGDMADSELPCTLPDQRIGWCKKGRCKDVCPAGFSYSPLDTQCHKGKGCGTGCSNCVTDVCLDEATTRPMLED